MAWQLTWNDYTLRKEAWVSFFKKFNTGDFEKIYPPNNLTYYEHIHGILQHDAYHLGQMVISAVRGKKRRAINTPS
jgi:hypothetical protein